MTFSTIWPVVLGLFAVIGAIASLIKVIEYFGKPREKLSAVVSKSYFAIPESLREVFKGMQSIRYASTVSGIFTPKLLGEIKISEQQAFSCALAFSEYLDKNLPSGIPDGIEYLNALWSVRVNNKGKRPCPEVRVTIPAATLVSIERTGSDKELRRIKEVVDLGTMTPGETVELEAWSGHGSWGKEVTLSHANGIGRVQRLELVPHFWKALSENWKYGRSAAIGIAIGIGIVSVYAVFFSVIYRHGSAAQPTNSVPAVVTNAPALKLP